MLLSNMSKAILLQTFKSRKRELLLTNDITTPKPPIARLIAAFNNRVPFKDYMPALVPALPASFAAKHVARVPPAAEETTVPAPATPICG